MDNRKTKMILLCVLLLGCVLTSIAVEHFAKSGVDEMPAVPAAAEQAAQAKLLKVYVSGAVQRPGIYDLPAGSRATDAVAKAGGFTELANLEKVNLAKKLKDGSQVNVPSLSAARRKLLQKSGETTTVKTADTAVPEKVNINTADLEQLDTLPGVGRATAQKIIDYRSSHPFTKIEDLKQVSGIGEAKFAQMQDRVCL